MALEKGIGLRFTHRPRRRRIAEAAENGETSNQLHPARMNPKQVRLRLHRDKRGLCEEELEREEHWTTAFTEDQSCGNGGEAARGDWSSNQGCEC